MLFARWRHHLWFLQRFAYAPFNAMVTKISKWSRIQDSCRITPKIVSLVVCAMLDIPSKFQKDSSITLWVILLTDKQTNKNRQKHNLFGGGNYSLWTLFVDRFKHQPSKTFIFKNLAKKSWIKYDLRIINVYLDYEIWEYEIGYFETPLEHCHAYCVL